MAKWTHLNIHLSTAKLQVNREKLQTAIFFYCCLYLSQIFCLFQICDSDDFDFGTLDTNGFCTDSKSRLSASVCKCENVLDYHLKVYIELFSITIELSYIPCDYTTLIY